MPWMHRTGKRYWWTAGVSRWVYHWSKFFSPFKIKLLLTLWSGCFLGCSLHLLPFFQIFHDFCLFFAFRHASEHLHSKNYLYVVWYISYGCDVLLCIALAKILMNCRHCAFICRWCTAGALINLNRCF